MIEPTQIFPFAGGVRTTGGPTGEAVDAPLFAVLLASLSAPAPALTAGGSPGSATSAAPQWRQAAAAGGPPAAAPLPDRLPLSAPAVPLQLQEAAASSAGAPALAAPVRTGPDVPRVPDLAITADGSAAADGRPTGPVADMPWHPGPAGAEVLSQRAPRADRPAADVATVPPRVHARVSVEPHAAATVPLPRSLPVSAASDPGRGGTDGSTSNLALSLVPEPPSVVAAGRRRPPAATVPGLATVPATMRGGLATARPDGAVPADGLPAGTGSPEPADGGFGSEMRGSGRETAAVRAAAQPYHPVGSAAISGTPHAAAAPERTPPAPQPASATDWVAAGPAAGPLPETGDDPAALDARSGLVPLRAESAPGSGRIVEPPVPTSAGAASRQLPAHYTAEPGRIGTVAVQALLQGDRRLVVALEPAALGRVEIGMELRADGRLAVRLRAQKAEALERLQREGGSFARIFAEHGLEIADDGVRFELLDDDAADPGRYGPDPRRQRATVSGAAAEFAATLDHLYDLSA